MDLRQKLSVLADAAKYDVSCASSGTERASQKGGLGNTQRMGICHSFTPDGRCISLLKILLTNYCVYDCQYCVNRRSSDVPRVRFTAGEITFLTIEFYKRNYIDGLFLSSGVVQSPDHTMEQMIQVARSLRQEHAFNGYIHLKAVPGASEQMLAAAGLWADRLSANIEMPTPSDLTNLAPQKSFPVIEEAMHQIAWREAESKQERPRSVHAPKFAPAGQSTQMVIGATPSPDQAILGTASTLYQRYKLRRVYYSAFTPIPNARVALPVQSPPLVREHRLYQADWLMRFYGFQAGELTTAGEPNLDLNLDPKLAWALRHREFFPVDVNRASRSQLLRVPGIGVRNVQRIVHIRRFRRLRLADLAKLRVSLNKTRPFVVTEDHNPEALRLDRQDLRQRVVKANQQLELFQTVQSATTGEV